MRPKVVRVLKLIGLGIGTLAGLVLLALCPLLLLFVFVLACDGGRQR